MAATATGDTLEPTAEKDFFSRVVFRPKATGFAEGRGLYPYARPGSPSGEAAPKIPKSADGAGVARRTWFQFDRAAAAQRTTGGDLVGNVREELNRRRRIRVDEN